MIASTLHIKDIVNIYIFAQYRFSCNVRNAVGVRKHNASFLKINH